MIKKNLILRFSSAITTVALLLLVMPSYTASANYSYDSETGIVTVTGTLTSYFYRLPFDAQGDPVDLSEDNNTFIYGYGYGYANGTYSYGYGYGYGYAFFATNADDWEVGDGRLGFYIGASSANSTGATLPVDATGLATVSVAMELSASGLSGVTIDLPEGLTLNGEDGWDGSLAVTGTSTYSSLSSTARGLLSDNEDVVSVTVETGLDSNVVLSDEVIISLPLSQTSPTVVITNGAGTTITASACTGAEYTGLTTSTSQLTDPDNYSVSSGSACYVVGTGAAVGRIYIATRHFSVFAAGTAESTTNTTGGSGGSTKKDEEETTTLTPTTVADFADVTSLPTTDWRYGVVEKVASTGLFQGEVGTDGKRNFNMDGGMNRGMAATVVARYVGCDTATAPTLAPFTDVPVTEWYAPSVACLKEKGIVSGKTATTFDPGANVTRAEFLKMMIEGYLSNNVALASSWRTLMASAPNAFEDVSSGDWFAGYVDFASQKGLLNGYTENGKVYAKGNKTIIRIEAAAIVSNFLGVVTDSEA